MCVTEVSVAPSRGCFVNGFTRGDMGHQDCCSCWCELEQAGTARALVWVWLGGSVYIHVVAPGLALGSNCSSLSGLEGNLPLGAHKRGTFGTR